MLDSAANPGCNIVCVETNIPYWLPGHICFGDSPFERFRYGCLWCKYELEIQAATIHDVARNDLLNILKANPLHAAGSFILNAYHPRFVVNAKYLFIRNDCQYR